MLEISRWEEYGVCIDIYETICLHRRQNSSPANQQLNLLSLPANEFKYLKIDLMVL